MGDDTAVVVRLRLSRMKFLGLFRLIGLGWGPWMGFWDCPVGGVYSGVTPLSW